MYIREVDTQWPFFKCLSPLKRPFVTRCGKIRNSLPSKNSAEILFASTGTNADVNEFGVFWKMLSFTGCPENMMEVFFRRKDYSAMNSFKTPVACLICTCTLRFLNSCKKSFWKLVIENIIMTKEKRKYLLIHKNIDREKINQFIE